MPNIICGKCKVKMQKEKSGLKIKLPNDYCRYGDLFRCSICGTEVIGDLGKAHPDQNPDRFDFELKRRDQQL